MRIFLLVIISYLLAFASEAQVRLAVSNATSGPASELGHDLNNGAELYFSQLKGIDVVLDKKDDGYEPSRAMHNTRDFSASNHSILFNYLGTPTTKAVFNYVKAKGLTLFAPYTGADFLRHRDADFIFNLRASYEQEAEFQANYFIEQLKLVNLGIVIQADDFGLAFEKYFVEALKRHGVKPKFISRFKRNSNNVMKAASQINRVNVEAVVFIGTYEPMSTLINNMSKTKPDLIYSSVSFVSSDQLTRRISPATKLMVTEVVPEPKTCQFLECKLFRRLAKQNDVHINHGSFEGFLNAYWLSYALEGCREKQTTECVLQQLEQSRLELLGKQRNFNSNNRQLLDEVFVTSLNMPVPHGVN